MQSWLAANSVVVPFPRNSNNRISGAWNVQTSSSSLWWWDSILRLVCMRKYESMYLPYLGHESTIHIIWIVWRDQWISPRLKCVVVHVHEHDSSLNWTEVYFSHEGFDMYSDPQGKIPKKTNFSRISILSRNCIPRLVVLIVQLALLA